MQPDNLLTHCWYFGVSSKELTAGKLIKKTILGQPVVFGRKKDGQVFALKNVCPHQGMPLSYGKFDGDKIQCCFHGWEFNTQGACTHVPSLVAAQQIDISHIKTPTYPCREHQGLVWIFVGDKGLTNTELPPLPIVPGVEDRPTCAMTQTTLLLPSHIDYAVIALMDPAHVPFVHDSWWFRSPKTMKEKSKQFVPSNIGYTMVNHKASTPSKIYALLGGVPETEISFQLPSIRIEHMTIGGKTVFTGLTVITPIDETQSEISHLMFWPIPWMGLFSPVIQHFSDSFLAQDQQAAERQQEGLKSNANLMPIIKDAGTPVKWYFELKRAWLKAVAENQGFENPLKAEKLYWRS
ncbi:MAG: aromatic ring-hydroxylating dioxygenase subunit alpha [Vampirovibrio sp.]|nr:aromatic ring-hydroxylating dioxygenase subunit alpha [Vampirovibrio sp.]